PRARVSARLLQTGAAKVPVMPRSNSFNVNGLCEIEEEWYACVWPLAGTPVPNSYTARRQDVPANKQSPLARQHFSQYRFVPVLERLLDLVQELVGDGTVHHAVVVAQRHIAHRADGDGVIDDHRALLDGAETEDPHVGLADYRQTERAAKDARIGDGEGALLDFLGLQFFRASALRKVEKTDRKSTRLNSIHVSISYAVFCLKKKKDKIKKSKEHEY